LEWATHPAIERMLARKRRLAQRVTLLALILIAAFVLRFYLAAAVGAGVGIAIGAVYLLSYLLAVVMLPLMFFALMKFAYSVFLRPFVRVWHINRIRNKRHLKEVLQRGREEE
jgi:membrane protein implicated in regulation of membrane protease activity